MHLDGLPWIPHWIQWAQGFLWRGELLCDWKCWLSPLIFWPRGSPWNNDPVGHIWSSGHMFHLCYFPGRPCTLSMQKGCDALCTVLLHSAISSLSSFTISIHSASLCVVFWLLTSILVGAVFYTKLAAPNNVSCDEAPASICFHPFTTSVSF